MDTRRIDATTRLTDGTIRRISRGGPCGKYAAKGDNEKRTTEAVLFSGLEILEILDR